MTGKKLPDPSELKIALDNRAFEIQLFWQRSNYFLVLMTALGIGTFSIKDPLFSPIIAFFATACSYFWFRTNLGSKFWQESWEVEVTELSKEFGVRSFEKTLAEVRDQVRLSLHNGQVAERRSLVRIWINQMTIKKPSVTYNMILLSLISTILWFFVAAVLLMRTFVGVGVAGSEMSTKPPPSSVARQGSPSRKQVTSQLSKLKNSEPPEAPAVAGRKPESK